MSLPEPPAHQPLAGVAASGFRAVRWKIARMPLVGVAWSALAGIALADRFPQPLMWSLSATAALLLFVLAYPRTWNCWLLTIAAFAGLHTLRHQGNDARRLAAAFADGRQVVHATGIVWSEPEKPSYWSKTTTAHFRLKLESIEVGGRTQQQKNVVMNVNWAGAMPAYGDRIALTASARNLVPARNPGQFDFTRHLQRKGIFSELQTRYADDCHIVDHGHGARAQVFAFAAQRWIRERLERDLHDAPEIAALIQSMVLGLRGETPDEMKEMFQRTGTLHLFAVSGLNVAMLATIAWFILKPFGVRRKLAVFLIIPILCAYALATGLTASCVRATIMGSLLLIAFLIDRPPVVYNSLAAAALGILAWDTNQLFSPGFQFSFVLVFTIVWLAGRIQRRCQKYGQPDAFLPRPLWTPRQRFQSATAGVLAGAVGVTLSAWLGSLIFTAGYFHLFSPAAIFANLLAVPIAFGVLALGVASLLTSTFWTTGAIWFNNANWLCAKALISVVSLFAAVPGGHVYVELPRLAPPADCEFTVFDLGEGGATHLRAAGRDWMLDCGHAAHYPRTILPHLRSRGVNRLDGLLLTHGDVNHLGAAAAMLDDFAPREIVDSPFKDRSPTRRALHEELAGRRIGRALCVRGDVLTIGPDVRMRVLYPPAGMLRASADDQALVVRVECGEARALFTSDSGFITEQWLVQNEPDLRADVLIKGQHGKDFSGTSEFIARVQPQAVVCGALGYGESRAGLDEWAQRLGAQGIAVFRQDQCGAAQIELRAGVWTVRGFANGQTFKSRAR